MRRPPAKCIGCLRNRVAWVKPRVDYCYDCLPGGPFPAPACRACGSPRYFSDGLCEACHPGGPHHPGSCRGCLAWGVYRRYNRMCWACRWWATHYPVGDCDYCGRRTRIGEQRACRLCLEQARLLQEPGRALDLAAANRFGQQLFLANMLFQRSRTPRLRPTPGRHPGWFTRALPWRQETLFPVQPEPAIVRRNDLNADRELVAYCAAIVDEHAARHGWSKRQRNDVPRSLRLLQQLQDTPGATIRATDVLQLPRYDGNISSTIEVLAAAGLLVDDRVSRVEHYFASKTAGLPVPMRAELETWLHVMLEGSTTAPRQRSRDPQTVRLHIVGIAGILGQWAAAGHTTLAEITPEDIRNAMPKPGSHRHWAEYGLRSLFGVLKARKMVFSNPTRGMPSTPVNRTVPMPLDTEAIREALNSADPAVALAVALVAFHALTAKQIIGLQLNDIVDGRLSLATRTIPLADPVRVSLAAWLNYRASTWPNTINPHLLVSRRSAPRLVPVGRQFPWTNTNIRPQALREDRMLQEIHATGGDIRRLCDLFGITVDTAIRYAIPLGHPDLARRQSAPPRTPYPT